MTGAPRWAVAASLAIAAPALVGCVGSSPSSTAPRASSRATGRPAAIYRVALSGRTEVPPGAPSGRGDAIIAVHGTSLLCWRFAHLHGFVDATGAHIRAGGAGQTGRVVMALSTGPRLHHQGCVAVRSSLAAAIIADPGAYSVEIASARYRSGAVRAQL